MPLVSTCTFSCCSNLQMNWTVICEKNEQMAFPMENLFISDFSKEAKEVFLLEKLTKRIIVH